MAESVLSVCRGQPRTVEHEGRPVRTAIFKDPARGPVRVTREGLEGDAQADTRAHGGPDRALLVTSATHYPHWAAFLGRALEEGQFGENLTVSRAVESETRAGDVFRCGTAVVQVTKPRGPCFKIGIRVGSPAILDALMASGRWGFYVRVLEEGAVAAGDPWVPLASDPGAPLLSEVIAEKVRARRG